MEAFYNKARQAYVEWSALELSKRLGYLRRLRHVIVDNLDRIVDEIQSSTGKTPVEALTADIFTVLDGIYHLEKHTARALKTQKVPTPVVLMGKRSYIEYRPRGVVLIIAPWNFPFQLSLLPTLTAIAAGNTVILKPSEITPRVGDLIIDLMEKAGFPRCVVQVVQGGKEVGAALVEGRPDYIFFTGSVQTGKLIQAKAAENLIPTTLELGGKDPMIVCADANIARAVAGALWGGFNNCGQVCMSVERLLVHNDIYTTFVDQLVQQVGELTQGVGCDADLGAMTHRGQAELVGAQIHDALKQGARLLTGLEPDKWNLEDSLAIAPMVLVNITPSMRIWHEETFGPVLPVMVYDDEKTAVALANDSNYGLNASVWSQDMKQAQRIASRLITGSVVINDVMISVANPNLPFGGVKESGLGRYHGDVGLQSFCHQTAVVVDRGRKTKELAWYPYAGKYEGFYQLSRGLFGRKPRAKQLGSAFLHFILRKHS